MVTNTSYKKTMNRITIQIQSVIYKNELDSLVKAIDGIDNSIDYCHRKDIEADVQLIYGDASPNPALSQKDILRIKADYPSINFHYDYFGFNSGTAKGHNRMGENCQTDYMMIMNPDVILENTCLYEMLLPFQNNMVGMVEARQTPLELAKFYDDNTLETEWASTACTIFRTDIFHKLGGFDDNTFFMYCDDLDFSWRLRLEGYKIIYNPNAIIYHSKTLGNDGEWKPSSAEIYYSAEAAILMAYKYSNPERVEILLNQFKTIGGPDEKRAADNFQERQKKGNLPLPIDPEHRVAKFIGDYYSSMRFFYNK